jgi:hypothetical protein
MLKEEEIKTRIKNLEESEESGFGFEDPTVQAGPPKDDEDDFGFGDPSVQPGPPKDDEDDFGFQG